MKSGIEKMGKKNVTSITARTKAACRRFVETCLPSEARYFEVVWSATLGSLGLKSLSGASSSIVDAISERLSVLPPERALRTSLNTTMDYAILVLFASVVELRQIELSSGLSLGTASAVVTKIVSRSDIPRDTGQLLIQSLPEFITSIYAVDPLEESQGPPTRRPDALPADLASSGHTKHEPRRRPGGHLSPYIVCIIGAPPHLTVSVRLGRREFIPIIDPKDREFIYWLDQSRKGLGYVPFAGVCGIYTDKKTISPDENCAYIAHQRVNKFRDRLRRKGLDPDRLFGPERGRGFRRVFRRGEG